MARQLAAAATAGGAIRIKMHRGISMLQDGAPTTPKKESALLSFGRVKNTADQKQLHHEKSMNGVRLAVGLYEDYPLASRILKGAEARERALKFAGTKQLNHVRGTDGWWRSITVLEVRAMDNYMYPWLMTILNSLLAVILNNVFKVDFNHAIVQHWDAVYALVLRTSLAFLLVFRLNRVAIRFWETRTMWGNITHNTRNLVSGILNHCVHAPEHRDNAIRWAASFCVAAKCFIRGQHVIEKDELAGFLSKSELERLEDANHAPLYAASMVRYHLRKALRPNKDTPPQMAHAFVIYMSTLEELINSLVSQVSGMERVRSTPLPIVYVTHLRTFLFLYILLLPYVWVSDWGWATIPLVGFTAFALFGIEGASSECEIPFDQSRPNHLAMDGYCLVTLDSVMGLVVHEANMNMFEKQQCELLDGDDNGDDDDIEKQFDTASSSERTFSASTAPPTERTTIVEGHDEDEIVHDGQVLVA